jgi:hypothetical protein
MSGRSGEYRVMPKRRPHAPAHTHHLDPASALAPGRLSLVEILAGWRAAERELARLDPASEEARRARLTIDAYRRDYGARLDGTLKELKERGN